MKRATGIHVHALLLALDGAFFAAALGFGFEVAVFALVAVTEDFVDLVADFFAAAGFFAGAFFAAGFLATTAFLELAAGVFLTVDLAVAVFFAGAFAGTLVGALVFTVAGLGLAAGLFSFEASLFCFGASLTRPEGPLGREKIFFSSPLAMALANWVFCALPISSL